MKIKPVDYVERCEHCHRALDFPEPNKIPKWQQKDAQVYHYMILQCPHCEKYLFAEFKFYFSVYGELQDKNLRVFEYTKQELRTGIKRAHGTWKKQKNGWMKLEPKR